MRPTAFLYWEVSESSSDIKGGQIRGNHLGAEGKLVVIVLLNTDVYNCKYPLNVYFSFKSTKMLETGKICFSPFPGALTVLAVSQVSSWTALIPQWTPGTLHEGPEEGTRQPQLLSAEAQLCSKKALL